MTVFRFPVAAWVTVKVLDDKVSSNTLDLLETVAVFDGTDFVFPSDVWESTKCNTDLCADALTMEHMELYATVCSV